MLIDGRKDDVLLYGGHVIDPANGIDGPSDVLISNGVIAEVRPGLAQPGKAIVVDVTGRFVVPGIIDMHAHCFETHARSKLSLNPIVNTFSSGVTTVVDAGTAGWRDFPIFKLDIIDRAKIRILSYVNIVGQGMGSGGLGGAWEHEAHEMRPKLAAAVAEEYADVVVGIKTAHYWAMRPFDDEHLPWTAVDMALEAGDLCGLPIMVDFCPWLPERPYPDLLDKMRPGDIHTHVFAQQFPIIDAEGKVYDHLWKARDRGIIFDLGHGAASFWFRNAAPAIEQGFVPDSISTDLHTGNVNGPVIDMIECMNKVLNLGVPLHEVIMRSTVTPAKEIGHPELGTLSIGAEADIAVLDLSDGDFGFVDCGREKISGNQRLSAAMTFRLGEVVWNPNGLGLPLWKQGPTVPAR
ncbi:MAG: amidohydrolase/deacetylase family metallohydrolase [Thermomicrobiales bacterium]|nr:amidohydrolase/deacetylase family metallohydrolase [Thermomicrobiales bacterium]